MYYIGPYIQIMLPLLLVPSWALAIVLTVKRLCQLLQKPSPAKRQMSRCAVAPSCTCNSDKSPPHKSRSFDRITNIYSAQEGINNQANVIAT